MKIAIASGKGGTGKTTVAVNLALAASRNGHSVAYVDCDVEEPNGHIFLKPHIRSAKPIGRPVPRVDMDACKCCGTCGDICQYSAIVCLPNRVLVYPELCHACGGCVLACPAHAITEVLHEAGKLESGRTGAIHFVHGVLNVGEAMSTPLVRQVKAAAPAADLVLFDSPPGTSCPVIESVRGTDFVVLVTEPTPFGLHDLRLAVGMTHALGLRFGVVVNRAGAGDGRVAEYCRAEGIEMLAEIPEDRGIAEACSRGLPAWEACPETRAVFERLAARLMNGRAG